MSIDLRWFLCGEAAGALLAVLVMFLRMAWQRHLDFLLAAAEMRAHLRELERVPDAV